MRTETLKKHLAEYDNKRGLNRKYLWRSARSTYIEAIYRIWKKNNTTGREIISQDDAKAIRVQCDACLQSTEKDSVSFQIATKISSDLLSNILISIQSVMPPVSEHQFTLNLPTEETFDFEPLDMGKVRKNILSDIKAVDMLALDKYESQSGGGIFEEVRQSVFKQSRQWDNFGFFKQNKSWFERNPFNEREFKRSAQQPSIIDPKQWHNPNGIAIEKIVHYVWFGGILSKKHQNRLQQWKEENPNYEMYLWFDSKHIDLKVEEVREMFAATPFVVSDIRELQNDKNAPLFLWVDNLYEIGTQPGRVLNFAAMSDIIRYLALQKYGGWYFDTDITPTQLKSLKPHYGFYIYIHLDENTGEISSFAPSIIASVKNSSYCNKAVEILLNMATSKNYKRILDAITAKENGHYIHATMSTTGFAGFYAAKKLSVGGSPIVSEGELLGKIQLQKRIDLAGLMDIHHIYEREKSWYDPTQRNISAEQEFLQRYAFFLTGDSEMGTADEVPVTPITCPPVLDVDNESELSMALTLSPKFG